jgi:hypothetical protein
MIRFLVLLTVIYIVLNPLPLLFQDLLHGQKDRVFFSRNLIYILKQEHFRAFRPAGDI